jgi:transcriptional regulator with GAF, ATPase, and Fis domain
MKTSTDLRQKRLGAGNSSVVTEALGQSEPFLAFQERLSRVAPINRPVLLIGERGTGKELAAARMHYLSNRWQAPMVALNCAALSPSLIESELFGYERGAFTGALQRRFGRFETADRGTLFLDEIGSIPLEVQEKILRVVEYNVFERVGSSESIEVDVRIIAATNADLNELARKNRFKQDLLDRLSFEVLYLPPLRERKEDITHIDFHPFHAPYEDTALPAAEESPAHETGRDDLRALLKLPLKEAVWQLKVAMMENALQKTKYNQKKAARFLGLTYHQFRGLYRRYQSVNNATDSS